MDRESLEVCYSVSENEKKKDIGKKREKPLTGIESLQPQAEAVTGALAVTQIVTALQVLSHAKVS